MHYLGLFYTQTCAQTKIEERTDTFGFELLQPMQLPLEPVFCQITSEKGQLIGSKLG